MYLCYVPLCLLWMHQKCTQRMHPCCCLNYASHSHKQRGDEKGKVGREARQRDKQKGGGTQCVVYVRVCMQRNRFRKKLIFTFAE